MTRFLASSVATITYLVANQLNTKVNHCLHFLQPFRQPVTSVDAIGANGQITKQVTLDKLNVVIIKSWWITNLSSKSSIGVEKLVSFVAYVYIVFLMGLAWYKS